MFCFTPSEALKYPILIALACFASLSFAAESGAVASSEYRLSIEKSTAFRAAATEPAVPAREARKETVIAARFVDRPFAKLIDVAARDAALDPALVHAVISIESAYNPTARSPKGALGLMQVMPATAARYGVRDPGRSPAANLKAGTLYLSDLMQLFDSRIELVLAAYNAGENAVLRYGQRIPPYRETQQYVPAVLARYREWREEPLLPVVVPTPIRIEYLPGTGLNLDYLRDTGYR